MTAKLAGLLSKLGQVRKELTTAAAVAAAIASANVLTGQAEHYAVSVAAGLAVLAHLFVTNTSSSASGQEAAPPPAPTPSHPPVVQAPAPPPAPPAPLPPLIPPQQ